MDSRTVSFLVLAATLALAAALQGCGGGRRARAQHLLFITVDTLRTDRLGCYGGPNRPSPNIDQLAATGTLFRDAYAQRAVTLPSFTSFFTSKYPYEHGVLNNRKSLRAEEWTLAERLEEAGFRSRCYNSFAVLGPGRSNIEQGFRAGEYRLFSDEVAMTERVERFVRGKFGAESREFLWVHYMNPHKPYAPPTPYDRMFDPHYQGEFDGSQATLDRIYVERIDLADPDRRHIEALYDGAIAFVDGLIGRVLAALDASGHAADTLVVFAADHGEDLYSHNHYYYHANSVYRSSTSIPLIFRQPGLVRAGQVVTGMVETVDFMPTVLGWLGVDAGPGAGPDTALRGVDLGKVLTGEEEIRKSFAYSLLEHEEVGGRTEYVFAARNRDWMYVWNKGAVTPANPPREGRYPVAEQELYELAADADEQVNVVDRHPQVADRLYRAIQSWLERMTRTSLEDSLSEERRQELIEQGYIAPAGDERPSVERDPRKNGR